MLAALEVPRSRRAALLLRWATCWSWQRSEAHREVVARALQMAGQLHARWRARCWWGRACRPPRPSWAPNPWPLLPTLKKAGAAQAAGQLRLPQPGDLILIKGSEGMR
jgi:hypothetical protein